MEWVEEKIILLESHKESLERSIQVLKSMFKPWSPQVSESVVQHTSDSTPALPDGAVAANVAVLSSEEAAGVAMVERVLSKAQRARAIQQRLEDPKKSKVKVLHVSEKQNQPALHVDSLKSDSTQRGESVKTNNVNCVIHDTRPSNHGTDNNQNGNKTKMGNAYSGQRVQSVSVKSDSSLRSKVLHRPQSASGVKQVTGAHTSAPFQTNSRNNMSAMQSTYRASTTSVIRKTKQEKEKSALGAKREPVKSATVNNSNSGSHSSINNAKQSKQCMHDKPSINGDAVDLNAGTGKKWEETMGDIIPESRVNTNPDTNRTNTKVESDSANVVEGLSKLTLNEQSNRGTRKSKEQELEPKLFTLSKNGKDLKVPVRLKKLAHKYNKLQLKLRTDKLTQKVDTPHPASTFLSQVEQTFASGVDLMCQLHARQAQYMLNVYTNLLDVVNSLHLDTISESSHPADVLRAKVLMEYVLTMFQETEMLLQKSDFKWVWYSPSRKSVASRSRSCLQYSSYSDLELYMSAVFRLQMLQLQRDSQAHIASEVLTLLEALDPTASDYIPVLRASYSMLSRNPSRMPVIIQDTIGGDETIEEHS
ncbi:uncharacterized protein LOC127866213 isoform X3 [Dreissena polymorpha]|uniref:uncharacterized protein LOC127866213 isoform X3 n=1 Tax=Dreissena polymorpha TaxID=45954 RepID=UPI002264FB30|nr:uncharacterized protein LOC127866213 isoform X3 [Dreissena polymorpha]